MSVPCWRKLCLLSLVVLAALSSVVLASPAAHAAPASVRAKEITRSESAARIPLTLFTENPCDEGPGCRAGWSIGQADNDPWYEAYAEWYVTAGVCDGGGSTGDTATMSSWVGLGGIGGKGVFRVGVNELQTKQSDGSCKSSYTLFVQQSPNTYTSMTVPGMKAGDNIQGYVVTTGYFWIEDLDETGSGPLTGNIGSTGFGTNYLSCVDEETQYTPGFSALVTSHEFADCQGINNTPTVINAGSPGYSNYKWTMDNWDGAWALLTPTNPNVGNGGLFTENSYFG